MLAKEGKYDNTIFHRLIPGFMVSRRYRQHMKYSSLIIGNLMFTIFLHRYKVVIQQGQVEEDLHSGEERSEMSMKRRVLTSMIREESW